jgi:hypothetical protein
MKHVDLPLIELFGIAATRGMLGAGLALLLGERLSRSQNRVLGTILTVIGIITTVPFALDVLRRRTEPSRNQGPSSDLRFSR